MGFIQETARKIAGPDSNIINSVPIYSDLKTEEALKGLVLPETKNKFDTDKYGEEHPFDFKVIEGLYKKFGFITGVVDKYVDFVVGAGYDFKIINEVDNEVKERAEIIINDFLYDSDFDTLMRAWVKEGLLKGNGFLEFSFKGSKIDGMKLLNANSMYVKRDKKGKIEKYNQIIGGFSKIALSDEDVIEFKPEEIAHLKLNSIGSDAYGLGIIYPGENTINNIIGCEKDMHMLVSRKANVPYHVQIGDIASKRFPSDAAITGFGQKLEWLHNKHEWVTGPDINIKTVDFGNVGEKFDAPLKYDTDMLFFTFQVPEVLMGRGSIPEGLAQVQMEAFMMRVQSIQAEIEKIVEKQIIKKVLLSNGIDLDIEMDWGKSNNKERDAEITLMSSLVGRFGPALNTMIEEKIVNLLGFDTEKYRELKEVEKIESEKEDEDEEEKESPKTNTEKSLPAIPGERVEKIKGIYNELYNCPHCFNEAVEDAESDYELKEWLGFNYLGMKQFILNAVLKDRFSNIRADNKEELAQGYLNKEQIKIVKNKFYQAFEEGKSVNWIKNNIKEHIPDLYATDETGNMTKILSSDVRAMLISRTESTRIANIGNLDYLSENKMQNVRWISAVSERTCEDCDSENGRIYSVSEAYSLIPKHINCRCTFAGVTELDK